MPRLTRRKVLQIAGTVGAMAVAATGGFITERLLFANRFPNASVVRPKPPLTTGTLFSPSSVIAQENLRPGTSAWQVTPHTSTNFIQGYAGQVSAVPGTTVPLYISTILPCKYAIEVYRIGWYAGRGGRLVFSRSHLTSQTQGYWTPITGLVARGESIYDPETNLIDANWRESFALPIGHDWVSGVYLIKLLAENHAQSYIPLVVRDPTSTADVLFNLAVNTYQAYNVWGGFSLYKEASQDAFDEATNPHKATKVSFNRPYNRGAGAGDFLNWEIHTLQWAERNGLDVTYTTNIDVAEQPSSLLTHRIFLSVGHDEYWTQSMRNGVETARDEGVSLAFLGANAAYWQARLEPDHAHRANRTLVCYKVATDAQLLNEHITLDPLHRQQPQLVTSLWRDPAVGRPENALLGVMYRSYIAYALPHGKYYLPDWVVSAGPPDPLLAGTGLTPDHHIPGGLLGYEYDGIVNNGHTPPSLVVLARSPLIDVYGKHDIARSAYYYAPSGAMVFAAGTIWWGWGLNERSPNGASEPNLLKGSEPINLLTRNILQAMLLASPPRVGGNTMVPTEPAEGKYLCDRTREQGDCLR